MRLTQKLPFLILLFLFSFCKKSDTSVINQPVIPEEEPQPQASFTASKCFPKAGESVKFTNTSKNAETYEWDFGDGEKSSEASPEHIYYNKGKYKVRLKVWQDAKVSFKDTMVYCDMKATIKITFIASNFSPASGWPLPGLSIDYTTSIYNYPDTTKALEFKYGSTVISNYQKQHIVSYAIPDEFNNYIVRCSVRVIGFTSGPNPNAEYVFQKRVAYFYTDTFNIFNTPSLVTSTKRFDYIDINYWMSPVEYN